MTPLLATHFPPSANDRFKETFAAKVWLSLILATLLHVLPFRFFPVLEVEDWTRPPVDVPDVVQFAPPPPPEAPAAVQKPGIPVVSPDVHLAATMPKLAWDAVPNLPAPPPVTETAGARDVPFIPYTVAPKLQNTDEVGRMLQRVFPATLRDAGIGGVVHLLVHIDVLGGVIEARIGTSSGYNSLDGAALRVAEIMSFSPAMNRDLAVAVWIELPVTFRAR